MRFEEGLQTAPETVAAGPGARVSAFVRLVRWRFFPFQVVPFTIAFTASGGGETLYLVLGLACIFFYRLFQDYANIVGDRVEDEINHPQRTVLARRAGWSALLRVSWVATAIFVLLVIAMALWAGLLPRRMIVWAMIPIFSWAYSFGPRLKTSTFGSPLVNAFVMSIWIYVGWTGGESTFTNILPYIAIVTVARWSLAVLGWKDVGDRQGDEKAGYDPLYLQVYAQRHPVLAGLPILLSPFVLLAVFGATGLLIGAQWPIAFAMLPVAYLLLRMLIAAKTDDEATGVREAGNIYQLIFVPVLLFDIHPEPLTPIMGAAGIACYLLLTRRFHMDPNELSPSVVSAMVRLARTWRSTAPA